MVSTRGRHPVVAPGSATTEQINLTELTTHLELSPITYDQPEDEVETIGSRLRKRRRTGSLTTDATSLTPKHSNPRKTASPSYRRAQATFAITEAAEEQDPILTPDFQPYATKRSLQDDPVQIIENGSKNTSITNGHAINGIVHPPFNVNDGPSFSDAGSLQQEPLPISSVAPDLAAVIASIIEHGEAIERRYGEMGQVDTESFGFLGASHHLKTQSLPILDNLATQILNTLAKSTYQEILTIATDPESESGQAYATLKSLFDHTKKVYSIQDPFLSPYELELIEPAHVDTIRKANMATFVSSVFGSQDVGFYYLNEYFLDTFVADGNRLLKSQAQLFLDLKTQAYISAISNGERSRAEILEDLFPTNLEERLLSRRPGAKQLAPSEADFLQRARNRSKALLEELMSEEAITSLSEKYIWEDFLRDVSAYVSKNFAAIVGAPARRSARSSRSSNFFVTDQQQQQAQRRLSQQRQEPEQILQQDQVQPSTEPLDTGQIQFMTDTDDIAEKAARAAHFAIQGFDMNQAAQQQMQNQVSHQQQDYQYHFENHTPSSNDYHQSPYQYAQQGHSQYYEQAVKTDTQYPVYGDPNTIPYPTQSAPTQVLYERARMAATAKASPNSRRAGHPSQRRPWTTDEENALMAGLDRVKGPHWSQILAMFGPGGTINETLKDRNQVQLKDKARNLKLFFLKSNIEVPYYLSFVTGELKTRAPAQAAKNEAKKKQRASEDHAQTVSILTPTWGSAEDGEQGVNGETGIEEDGMDNETEDGVGEEENEADDGVETGLEEGSTSIEGLNGESPMSGICNGREQPEPLGNNAQTNGNQTAENMDLDGFLADASRLGLNEATRHEDMLSS